MPASVFLSHNRADKPFARRLAADLQRAGGDVWLDEEQIALGDSIQEIIQNAIDTKDYLAVVLSPDSVQSKWVRQELRQALDREINSERVVVLPLLHRDCDIPGFLRDKLYADFRDDEAYPDALNKLKQRLGLTLTQPPDESERQMLFMTHNMNSRLWFLDHRMNDLASEHPELTRDFRGLTAITGNVRRGFRQFAVLQAFSQGTYELRLNRPIKLGDAIQRLLIDQSLLVDPARKIDWRIANANAIPPIAVDDVLIDVAFSNLIDNAFKYSYSNTTIMIDFEPRSDAVAVRFQNQGITARSDVTEDIFAHGYRGAEAAMVTASGSGIGLYMAQLIVAAHGGEITYDHVRDSSINVFTVSLPRHVA